MKSEALSLKSIMNKLDQQILIARIKLTEKISDPCNAKKYYQSFIRKKKTKSVKPSEINTYQAKTLENRNIVDIKSVITEHPKTSHKLSKTIREAKKVGSNSSLYSTSKK